MQSFPELKFVVDEPRSVTHVIMMWVARTSVAAAFLFIGATKLQNNPDSMWVQIFERIGFGQWFRYATGVIQMTGALLLLTPWTITIGAVCLAATMVGALVVDVVVMGAIGYALVPLVLLGIIVAVWFAGRFGSSSWR